MIELLTRSASEDAARVAVISQSGEYTYRELLDDAVSIASELKSRGLRRAALVEPDVAWVIRILAAASLVGTEVCQLQADLDGAVLAEHLSELGYDSVITQRSDIDGVSVVAPTDLTAAVTRENWDLDHARPIVILTTGTTGRPKAVLHDWATLVAHADRGRPKEQATWLLAYGPHQFAGIQVMLHSVSTGSRLVAPFPRGPRAGLGAIRAERVTSVSATPTFWRFLLSEIEADGEGAPGLDQVTLGGEAIPERLLEDVTRTFPAARVSQVYASTEFGSLLSVGDGRPGLDVGILETDNGHEPRAMIRDGELWVRPRGGMRSYAGEPASAPSSAWMPTGDRVEVVGDRIHFCGRVSDIINVGGVKVHPLPVEEKVLAVPGVAAARVYGRSNPLTGAIVAVDIVAEVGASADNLDEMVRTACVDLPPAWRPRRVRVVDHIATRGGKTVRGIES